MNKPKYLQLDYIDNCIEKTLLWMNGTYVHRNNECVIDFSCCYSELKTPYVKRIEMGGST